MTPGARPRCCSRSPGPSLLSAKYRLLALFLLCIGSLCAQQTAVSQCDLTPQSAPFSISAAGTTLVIGTQNLPSGTIHVCKINLTVKPSGTGADLSFSALTASGTVAATLANFVAVTSYGFDWHGQLTTKAGGPGAPFGITLVTSGVTVAGAITYYQTTQ